MREIQTVKKKVSGAEEKILPLSIFNGGGDVDITFVTECFPRVLWKNLPTQSSESRLRTKPFGKLRDFVTAYQSTRKEGGTAMAVHNDNSLEGLRQILIPEHNRKKGSFPSTFQTIGAKGVQVAPLKIASPGKFLFKKVS